MTFWPRPFTFFLLTLSLVALPLGSWHVPRVSPAVWCHQPEYATCFPRLGLQGSGAKSRGRGPELPTIPWPCAHHQDCCRADAKGAGLGKLIRQGEGGGTRKANETGGRGGTREADETDTHLAPDQLPNTNKQAPEPLLRGQWGAAEGLSTKLDNDNLQERVGGRRVQPAHLFIPPSSSSTRGPSHPALRAGSALLRGSERLLLFPGRWAQRMNRISSFCKFD